MAKPIDWEARIGRRVRLRDLHVLFTVVQSGSMAKAGQRLGVSQSAVSQMIAELEHALGVRLLDRGPRGVEPTIYGRTLIRRGRAAFDELKQGVQEIEFLNDPTTGEIRIGCPESISAALLPPIVQRFYQEHPRVILDVDSIAAFASVARLRERSLDLLFLRDGPAQRDISSADDIGTEVIFRDRLIVAAGIQSPWARRRKVNLAELADAPWIVTPYGWGDEILPQAFKVQGLALPKVVMKTFSIHLRTNMIASGQFVTALPQSVLQLYGDRLGLKALPVNLEAAPWTVAILTLKNRTVGPAVERFIECARKVAKEFEKTE